MAEVTPSLKEITPKSSKLTAKIAGAALAAGIAFGVSTPDQGGIRPITASAAGETPTRTPTPTPDPQIETQKASNTQVAGIATTEARARQTEQARLMALNQLQNEYNKIQDQRAAAQPTATPNLAQRREEQATREAAYDATSTKTAALATQTASTAAATATEQADRARATATETAIIKRERERQGETVDMWKKLLTWLGIAGGVSAVGAAVKHRGTLKIKVWDRVKQFFNF